MKREHPLLKRPFLGRQITTSMSRPALNSVLQMAFFKSSNSAFGGPSYANSLFKISNNFGNTTLMISSTSPRSLASLNSYFRHNACKKTKTIPHNLR